MNEVVTQIIEWVTVEGPLRTLEHIIVLLVIIKVLRSAFRIESRGKTGLINYFTKLVLRFTDRIGFIKNKKEKFL